MHSGLRIALFKATKALADYEDISVKWPNVNFNPDGLQHYFQVSILPVNPRVLVVCDGGSEYKWIYRISVYMIDGIGEIEAYRLVDKIKAAFPVNKVLTGGEFKFKVVTPANPAPVVRTEGWSYIPVQFRCQVIS